MQHQTLIYEALVQKARDSYTFLHLMERDTQPFVMLWYSAWIGLP